jgi:galactose mutarotase-like enzyme
MKTTLRNDLLVMTIDSKGAELTSVRTLPDGHEYLWQRDPKYWAGQSPVFFPVIGKLENSRYILDGQTYEMGVHGFARDSEFTLTNSCEGRAGFRLSENETTLGRYPFKFNLDLDYTLEDRKIEVSYTVTNRDVKTMPFSIGGHPGFICPFEPGESMDDYVLEFERRETLGRRIVQDGFLTAQEEPFMIDTDTVHLSKQLFERLAIVLRGVRSSHVTLRSPRGNRYVTVTFGGFTYIAFWSPASGGDLLCIEPWHGVLPTKGAGEELGSREGINFLAPGGQARYSFSILIG